MQSVVRFTYWIDRILYKEKEDGMTKEASRILAIEDNADIRQLISLILEREGYQISTAADGISGLSLIKETKPDLVLLDVMLPEFSGFEVLDALRKDKNSKVREVPVLMITSKSTVEDVDQALELGATGYLVKPFRPEKLVQKVRELLIQEDVSI